MQYSSLPPALAGCNALVVATGARDPSDPLGPLNVELNGNLNLIEAAKRAGVTRFVLVTSIGADDLINPLNLFWGARPGAGASCGRVICSVLGLCLQQRRQLTHLPLFPTARRAAVQEAG